MKVKWVTAQELKQVYLIHNHMQSNSIRLIKNMLDDNTVKTTKKTSKPYFRMNEKF